MTAIHGAWDGVPGDCNGNGIGDSTDIAERMEDDVNRNGIIDFCDPDSMVRMRDELPTTFPGTSKFRVRHRQRGVEIRYRVPRGALEWSSMLRMNVTGGSLGSTWHETPQACIKWSGTGPSGPRRRFRQASIRSA